MKGKIENVSEHFRKLLGAVFKNTPGDSIRARSAWINAAEHAVYHELSVLTSELAFFFYSCIVNLFFNGALAGFEPGSQRLSQCGKTGFSFKVLCL